MDHIASRDADIAVDIESGEGTTSDEDSSKELYSSSKQPNELISRACGAFIFSSENGEYGINSCSNGSNLSGVSVENLQVVTDRLLEEQDPGVPADRETVKKPKNKSAKKSCRPPRPPRGPSLDASDQKLIREINELALLKRARIERVRALKKMKAAKTTSSNGNLFALLFTVFFFLVILFQGMSSGSLPIGNHGSPESAAGTVEDLISVKFPTRLSPLNTNGLDYVPPRKKI